MTSETKALSFIDLFSGCGGLSLGLMKAGWRGLFAIEKSNDAFKTLKHNLVSQIEDNNGKFHFDWPSWLEKKAFDIKQFVRTNRQHLIKLRGGIQLVAGGPPCQGFSFAGRRTGVDPRNELFRYYLEVVEIVNPLLVIMENVRGIEVAFGEKKKSKKERSLSKKKSYAFRIRKELEEHGYNVQQHVIKAMDFGVPQLRPRYFLLGIRDDLKVGEATPNFYEIIYDIRREFLKKHRLPISRPVTVCEAISDLTTKGKKLVECNDIESPGGFKEILYEGPQSNYQKLMHRNMNGRRINSLRLVNHLPKTVQKFQKILETCRKGIQLSENDRLRLGIRKNAITPLDPNRPSSTLTTLPDDFLHYSEPRIHTIREHARLQSFPDWFEFRGKYTTGGPKRVLECPRYTQVGNAVPPLLAEAIGEALKVLLHSLAEHYSEDNAIYISKKFNSYLRETP
jgi:DNA (cytosine-5)-methyltransferase 1